jgi:hypothetical protein
VANKKRARDPQKPRWERPSLPPSQAPFLHPLTEKSLKALCPPNYFRRNRRPPSRRRGRKGPPAPLASKD